MIEYSDGDILRTDVEVICNPVNCEGVMGKGLALQFKLAYPLMFEEYKRICLSRLLKPGMVHIYEIPQRGNPLYIYNVATKARWENRSSMAHIVKAMGWIVGLVREQKVRSIAIPALGCGLGNLNWDEVRPVMERMSWPLKDVKIVIFPPKEEAKPNAQSRRSA